MNKIQYYAGLGLLAALAVGTIGCANTSKKEKKVVIPGTWTYDIDSMRLSKSKKEFEERTSHLELSFPSELLTHGANDDDCDLWWFIIDRTKRRLLPENGAEFALLGKADFEKITLEDLLSAKYSPYISIPVGYNNNYLPSRTVIGVKTNQGNYAKIRIDGYSPLIYKEGGKEKIGNYDLLCTIALYKSPKQKKQRTERAAGYGIEKEFAILGTQTYDLDSMRFSGDDKQFRDWVNHFGMKISLTSDAEQSNLPDVAVDNNGSSHIVWEPLPSPTPKTQEFHLYSQYQPSFPLKIRHPAGIKNLAPEA